MGLHSVFGYKNSFHVEELQAARENLFFFLGEKHPPAPLNIDRGGEGGKAYLVLSGVVVCQYSFTGDGKSELGVTTKVP